MTTRPTCPTRLNRECQILDCARVAPQHASPVFAFGPTKLPPPSIMCTPKCTNEDAILHEWFRHTAAVDSTKCIRALLRFHPLTRRNARAVSGESTGAQPPTHHGECPSLVRSHPQATVNIQSSTDTDGIKYDKTQLFLHEYTNMEAFLWTNIHQTRTNIHRTLNLDRDGKEHIPPHYRNLRLCQVHGIRYSTSSILHSVSNILDVKDDTVGIVIWLLKSQCMRSSPIK